MSHLMSRAQGEELEIPRIHHYLEGLGLGLLQFLFLDVYGDDLPAVQPPDDPLPPTADIEDEAGGLYGLHLEPLELRYVILLHLSPPAGF